MRYGEVSTQSIPNTGITHTPAIGNAHNVSGDVVTTISFEERNQSVSSDIYPTGAYGVWATTPKTIAANSSGWGKEFNINPNGDATYFGNIPRNTSSLKSNIQNNINHMVEAKQDYIKATSEIEDAKGILPEGTEFRTMPGVGAVCTINGVTITVEEAIATYAVT